MTNSDLGHKLTDKELAKLERRIATLYREAGEELQATMTHILSNSKSATRK